jgi:tRNA (guanine10-N2)-dimethyltransferase
MRYMFELSGEHPDLPIWEAEALLECNGEAKLIDRDYNLAVFSSDAKAKDFKERIAMAHFLSEHLASVEPSEITSFFKSMEIPRGKSVAVRVKIAEPQKGKYDPLGIAKEIGAVLSKKAEIDLEKPDERYRVFIGNAAYIGKEILEIDRTQYEKRKNRLMPFSSPISIHPRLARTLINLTARSKGCRILDPFCGTGTLLIEAAMMGMDVFASDISEKMIAGSGMNLAKLGLKARIEKLDVGDISKFGIKFDAIVTDPPYGRSSSTNKESILGLYSRALESFAKNLVDDGRVGIIVPDLKALDYKKEFKVVKQTAFRTHRSLVRNFVILELR